MQENCKITEIKPIFNTTRKVFQVSALYLQFFPDTFVTSKFKFHSSLVDTIFH